MEIPVWESQGYVLRPAKADDAEDYFSQNFDPLPPETARLTGCKTQFTREEVTGYFARCLADESRYDFLLISPDGRIIGESVINEIDPETRSANFRIGIFHPEDCGKGIGSWVIRKTRDFAFETLQLHRLALDVFSFNQRAIAAYRKAGFRQEGALRDAVKDGNSYADDVLMAMLEEEWREIRTKEE